jgi:hypothetical protein
MQPGSSKSQTVSATEVASYNHGVLVAVAEHARKFTNLLLEAEREQANGHCRFSVKFSEGRALSVHTATDDAKSVEYPVDVENPVE